MSDDTIEAQEREFLAREAWSELNALLTMIPLVDPERLEALRGLSIRAQALADLLYNAIRPGDPEELPDMRATVYGDGKAASIEFARWKLSMLGMEVAKAF